MVGVTIDSDTLDVLFAMIDTSSGKRDWQAVSAACNLPTPDAARMRYQRFKKAHLASKSSKTAASPNAAGTPTRKKTKSRAGNTANVMTPPGTPTPRRRDGGRKRAQETCTSGDEESGECKKRKVEMGQMGNILEEQGAAEGLEAVGEVGLIW